MTAATSASYGITTGTTGQPLSGFFVSLVSQNARAFAVLHVNGADEGARIGFYGFATNTVPSLTPASTGSYTVRLYDALTGGNLLVESATIAVTAPPAPNLSSGVAPSLTLDASASGALTSDSGLTTPQTTNGGTVLGWKDSTSNGYNFVQTNSAHGASLLTGSQNGKSGVYFPAASTGVLVGPSSAAPTFISDACSPTSPGFTMAMVFKIDATPSNSGYNFFSIAQYSFIQVALQYGNIQINQHNVAGQDHSTYVFVSTPPANTLLKVVATLNPATGQMYIFVNALSSSGGYDNTAASTAANYMGIGNTDGNTAYPNLTVYEFDLWQGFASGTGGATPTGDIATIMQYLTAKWAS